VSTSFRNSTVREFQDAEPSEGGYREGCFRAHAWRIKQKAELDPVLIILSLVFWFWMWGVLGAILAVPMLAILKIISDRLRPLKALGHFLEGE
jgi:AI-2E family transporter